MASTKIQAAERPIGDVFSDEYRFVIPRYQRPYAWTTEQAGEMFDDLLAASTAGRSPADADPYFLGSIVLVKADGNAQSEVVDGQQRLTTLTLLLAALRLHVDDEFAVSVELTLFQKGNKMKGTVDQPRLTLRERDHGFFEKHVQERVGIEQLSSFAKESLPDSQRNLVHNTLLFLDRLADLSQNDCHRLASFIHQRTYLVVVSTQDFDSAYRIFTVLNERGLDLSHADILKSEIIGEIPEPVQEKYMQKWESEEDDLGREDFRELFSHIRMVYAKTKARETILKEFRSSVLRKVPDPTKFIDEVLVPLSNAYEIVTRADYKAPWGADGVNNLLRWLTKLDNTDWVPPAISYFSRTDVDTAALHRFVTDLDRLAASMFLRRVDVTRRIERYGRVLEAIEAGDDLSAEDSPLQLDIFERAQTLTCLNSEIYTVSRIRLYLLLRLDSVLSTGEATYDHPLVTVEHVLPQSPAKDSQWRQWFSDDERAYWVHRLANLALLNRRKNTQASNYEFEIKKNKYFKVKNEMPPFALTIGIHGTPEWTPAVLEDRQAELVGVLSTLWRLS
ncbi:DUF262 domain-containing protein [Lentzea californiensis]|uniref:DUF262 domain-containing protein n=1 Tax=Lentzea californiensis TaxID=438851 RepID=UPI0021661F4E|nr:DUF262 domain-containing HNH endonuclease family protein [Lentzea californiensis]MCR3753748.1 Protein of unknown function (DUF1524) [Lentzea californiensis]